MNQGVRRYLDSRRPVQKPVLKIHAVSGMIFSFQLFADLTRNILWLTLKSYPS